MMLIACSSGSSPQQERGREGAGPAVSIQTATPAGSQELQKVLAALFTDPFEISVVEEALQITLRNAAPLTPDRFERLLSETGRKLMATEHPWKKVVMMAAGESGSRLRGEAGFSDLEAFQKNEISEPELNRRLQVEVIETPESLKEKTRVARRAGANEEALRLLRLWVQKEPQSVVAFSLLGNVLRDLRKYGEAVEAYQRVAELDPSSLFGWHNLGYSFEKIGSFDEAISAYSKALEIDATHSLLMQQLADVYRKNGDYPHALEWIKKGKAIKETSDLLLIEGNVCRDQKKQAQARDTYLKAQKLNPLDQKILFNLILVDLDTRRFGDARKRFGELRVKEPQLAGELAGLEVWE